MKKQSGKKRALIQKAVRPVTEPLKPIVTPIINPIRDLAESGRLAGILLLLATAISMIWANTANGDEYLLFWERYVGVEPLRKTIMHWINDGLMVIFFFFVGLEIKRELMEGELSTFRQALLPASAAIGGAVVPASLFLLFNSSGPEMNGWAIPTATDIAFSLGMLSLLGDRVPFSLKVFLTALAIIDDLIAVMIIALFYTEDIDTTMLLYSAGVVVVLATLGYFKVKKILPYVLIGIVLWFFVLKSGVHATIAGVLLALTIPLEKVDDIEHSLYKPVNYLIMPIFALANTAIILPDDMGGLLLAPLSLGIIAGLFLGKPLGILFMSWLAVRSRLVKLPLGMHWPHVIGLGFTAGIGFTMSIFITSLSFEDPDRQNMAKLAVIAGTLLSAIMGLLFLFRADNPATSPYTGEDISEHPTDNPFLDPEAKH
ncbi:Na+/H+ antiporter NhaA [Telluribacter sp.]|jgi:NhaA family Na+:H+ antiporter|uniref:Na+/H+ antiporter NhaA n=1 Tax=Telluribacter sp. TaxID=1978767 RepID=UPI002E13C53C|nr:Na+/H+ antiporter NhaA [Telluribacter sp.]